MRANDLYQRIESELSLSEADTAVMISVVTKGELLSLGMQKNWGTKKLSQLNALLRKIVIIDIHENDQALMDAYAKIDAYSQGRLQELPLGTSSRNMGKNDLWIAATAHVAKATLVTTDTDFDHLRDHFLDLKKYWA